MRSIRVLVAAAVVAALVACSGGDDDSAATTDDTADAVIGTTDATETAGDAGTSPQAATTTVAPGDDFGTGGEATDGTTADDTATVPDTAPDEQPFVPEESPFIPPPENSLVTTTTEPLAVQELVLRSEGIGSAVFGAEPQGVIDYVTSILGGNTADTGWVDPFTFADCRGEQVRRVDWGALSLLFGDVSDVANGRLHFIGWEYGRVGEITDEPVGLRTPGGVTRGTRIVDLLVEFPDAAVNEGEEDLAIPANFYVSDSFYGLLTGTSDDDYVTVMFGGFGCGE